MRRDTHDVVRVSLKHHQVADPDARCTKDILHTQTVVPLGSNFQEGMEYAILVNDWSGTLIP